MSLSLGQHLSQTQNTTLSTTLNLEQHQQISCNATSLYLMRTVYEPTMGNFDLFCAMYPFQETRMHPTEDINDSTRLEGRLRQQTCWINETLYPNLKDLIPVTFDFEGYRQRSLQNEQVRQGFYKNGLTLLGYRADSRNPLKVFPLKINRREDFGIEEITRRRNERLYSDAWRDKSPLQKILFVLQPDQF